MTFPINASANFWIQNLGISNFKISSVKGVFKSVFRNFGSEFLQVIIEGDFADTCASRLARSTPAGPIKRYYPARS